MPHRSFSVRLVAIVVLAASMVACFASAASADPKKPYMVSIQPASATAGTVVLFNVEITNNAKQTLGSANVTVPSDFEIVEDAAHPITITPPGTVSRSGNVLQLRNLSLGTGSSVTVGVWLQMPCTPGFYDWDVVAKQSNDFNGTGNDMGPRTPESLRTQVTGGGGSAGLRFGIQPTDAQTNTPIRALAFQPTSDAVTVEVLNACEQRDTSFNGRVELRLTPGGPVIATATAENGVASFPDLSIGRAGTFTLIATAGELTSPPSDEFEVFDVVEPCIAGGSCTATLSGTNTTSTVTGTGGSGTGFVVEALDFGLQPDCTQFGYTSPNENWYEFRTTVPRDKTVEARFNKDAVKTVGGVSKLQICFAAPRSFQGKNGTARFDYDGDGTLEGYVGLLPDCNPYKPPTMPCIKKRESLGGYDISSYGGSSSAARVVFIVPLVWGGDPRWH